MKTNEGWKRAGKWKDDRVCVCVCARLTQLTRLYDTPERGEDQGEDIKRLCLSWRATSVSRLAFSWECFARVKSVKKKRKKGRRRWKGRKKKGKRPSSLLRGGNFYSSSYARKGFETGQESWMQIEHVPLKTTRFSVSRFKIYLTKYQ